MDTLLKLGCHLSPSKGLLKMAEEAERLNAGTFQFFLRNPRGSRSKTPDPEEDAALLSRLQTRGVFPVLMHAPYTLNPCAAEKRVEEFAGLVLREDTSRMASFPGCFYNFHPGSHVGQGAEAGIKKTAALLRSILPEKPRYGVLLETMSGQGSEIGRSFEEIGALLEETAHEAVGVCLDTCHIFAAGYDIVNRPDEVLEEFDRRIGLEKLKFLHVNDSVYPLGSHRDRHAAVGEGAIGFDALYRFVHHPLLERLPMVLETPHEVNDEYAEEIRLLREGRQP